MKPEKSVYKQDLNFLAFPLWFQVSRSSGQLDWYHPDGYRYQASYRAPDQLDMLYFGYFLMRAQQENYAHRLEFSRYEILKGCGCPINPQYLKRLEDSLKRWQSVTIHFEQSFFYQNALHSKTFKLLDGFKLRDKDRRLEVHLNAEFLQQIKQSRHFKYVDFNYYRQLKRPVSRRLLEILTPAFKQSSQYRISLLELGKLLTLYSRKRKNKSGQMEDVLYPSDVLTAIRSAVDEINHLSTDADQLRELGMDPREIYGITYDLDKNRKVISFHKAPLTHLFDQLTQEPQHLQNGADAIEPQLNELLAYLKRQSRPLQELVTKYFHSHDYDYVKWNIFYANRNGSRNYVSYLKLCLQHNWAQEFREEYERMFDSSEHQVDERKLTALIKVAKQADHLLMANGKRFRIKRIFPNGAIEISSRQYKMDFVLSPAQAYGCRFEQAQPEEPNPRRRKPD